MKSAASFQPPRRVDQCIAAGSGPARLILKHLINTHYSGGLMSVCRLIKSDEREIER